MLGFLTILLILGLCDYCNTPTIYYYIIVLYFCYHDNHNVLRIIAITIPLFVSFLKMYIILYYVGILAEKTRLK